MRVKLFTNKSGWKGGAQLQFDALEDQINQWLATHPEVSVAQTHMLSQPTFGWGQLAVAVWYNEDHV
jgi:hypothetical protein